MHAENYNRLWSGAAENHYRLYVSGPVTQAPSLDFRHYAAASTASGQGSGGFCGQRVGYGGAERYRRQPSQRRVVSISEKEGAVLSRYQGRCGQSVAWPVRARSAYQSRTKS